MNKNDRVEREQRFPINANIRLVNDADDYAELAVIDLSRSGLGIDGPLHFPPETRVRIDFPSGQVRTGTTRRRDRFTSGVAFDVPMTESDLGGLWLALRNKPHFDRKIRSTN
ncbi:MAG: PilZ domain-containing protein [Sphingobium sp.]|nr:PilZ domain-containing protein [Sphingobium sp.]